MKSVFGCSVIQLPSSSRYKKRPVKIRMWDVGYHATIEHRDPQSNNKKIQKDGTHQSPRAHMRRGHWHTYLYGKGKEKRKVVWVSEQKIGHGEFIHTVREIEKRN